MKLVPFKLLGIAVENLGYEPISPQPSENLADDPGQRMGASSNWPVPFPINVMGYRIGPREAGLHGVKHFLLRFR